MQDCPREFRRKPILFQNDEDLIRSGIMNQLQLFRTYHTPEEQSPARQPIIRSQNEIPKFIYLSIYRHSDKTVLLELTNSQTSIDLQQICKMDFQVTSFGFEESELYEGMEEIDDFKHDYTLKLKMEMGGTPSWYSTCDKNLLVYSVLCAHSANQQNSQAAFSFLKECIQMVTPYTDTNFQNIESLDDQVETQLKQLIDSKQQGASPQIRRPSFDITEDAAPNTKTAHAQQNVHKTQELISNQHELGDLEARSGDLKNIAFNIKSSTDQLRKEAARRNKRLMIIITGIVGAAILAYIILYFVDSKQDN